MIVRTFILQVIFILNANHISLFIVENDLIYLILFNICKKKMVETYQHTNLLIQYVSVKKKKTTDIFKIDKDSEGILTLKTGVIMM